MLAQEMVFYFASNVVEFFKYINTCENPQQVKMESKLKKAKLENIKEIMVDIRSQDKKSVLTQFYYSFFKLMTKSTFKIYSGIVYSVVLKKIDI